jgi:hypothetical protein
MQRLFGTLTKQRPAQALNPDDALINLFKRRFGQLLLWQVVDAPYCKRRDYTAIVVLSTKSLYTMLFGWAVCGIRKAIMPETESPGFQFDVP